MEKIINRIYLFIVLSFLSPLIVFAEGNILALHPVGKDFQDALLSISQTLGADYPILAKEVKKDESWTAVQAEVQKSNPNLLILMDNSSLRLYQQYAEAEKKASRTPVPAIALMALQMERSIQGLDHIIAISYEIPVVTAIVNMRQTLKGSYTRIGVIHRASWEPFIKQNREFCKVEKASLISYAIPDGEKNIVDALNNGLEQLLEKDKVDAIWILNDNLFLNAQTLVGAWLPHLKNSKQPVIVGVESLLQSKIGLGSFAVLPDPVGLGSQAANLIFEIIDNGWQVNGSKVVQPLSVLKVVNSDQVRKKGLFSDEGLKNVDREVK